MLAMNIEWDTDGIDAEELGLPDEVEIPEWVCGDIAESMGYAEDIEDWLSDEFGYCVYGFDVCS